MRPGIADKGQTGLDPALQALHLGRIRKERRQVILPQRKEATGKVRGVGHRTTYMPWSGPGKRPDGCRRAFDEAIRVKHCIVAEGTLPRGETPRA
jgi:hypothetical protein